MRYRRVWEPLITGDVIVGAAGVDCDVATPANQIQTPAPFLKKGNALPTVIFGKPAVVLTVVVAEIPADGLGIAP